EGEGESKETKKTGPPPEQELSPLPPPEQELSPLPPRPPALLRLRRARRHPPPPPPPPPRAAPSLPGRRSCPGHRRRLAVPFCRPLSWAAASTRRHPAHAHGLIMPASREAWARRAPRHTHVAPPLHAAPPLAVRCGTGRADPPCLSRPASQRGQGRRTPHARGHALRASGTHDRWVATPPQFALALPHARTHGHEARPVGFLVSFNCFND
ncbi:unnamed protein product, partial [Urochloa humidicola]